MTCSETWPAVRNTYTSIFTSSSLADTYFWDLQTRAHSQSTAHDRTMYCLYLLHTHFIPHRQILFEITNSLHFTTRESWNSTEASKGPLTQQHVLLIHNDSVADRPFVYTTPHTQTSKNYLTKSKINVYKQQFWLPRSAPMSKLVWAEQSQNLKTTCFASLSSRQRRTEKMRTIATQVSLKWLVTLNLGLADQCLYQIKMIKAISSRSTLILWRCNIKFNIW